MYLPRLSLSLSLSFFALGSDASDLHFSSKHLDLVGYNNVDLSFFEKGNVAPPGVYNVIVKFNGKNIVAMDVEFKIKNGKLISCLKPNQLDYLGLQIESYTCDNELSYYIPGLVELVEIDKMLYTLIVPQKFLKKNDYFKTSASRWQGGGVSLLANYNLSGFDSKTNNSKFLSLDSSLNLIDGWRLYNNSNAYLQSKYNDKKINSLMTNLKKNYDILQGAELSVGENFLGGDLFDSFPFKGVKLSSSDDMLLSSFSSFSPVVRGIADSQSIVRIYQADALVYEQVVQQGPFEFSDIPNITGGILKVVIEDSAGSIREYNQSVTNIPLLLKPGRFKYNLSAGEITHKVNFDENPYFLSPSLAYGFGDSTIYGGVIYNNHYSSQLIGIAHYNSLLGGMSFDITNAISISEETSKKNGQSIRLNYSRGFESGANITISGYRFATDDFYSFSDFINKYKFKEKERVNLTIQRYDNQLGSLSFNGDFHSYYNTRDGYQLYGLWSKNHGYFSTSLSLGYSKTPSYNNNKNVLLSFSIPLGAEKNIRLNSSVGEFNHNISTQTSLSGYEANNNFSWSLSNSIAEEKPSVNNANISWGNRFNTINAGVSNTKNTYMYNYSARGGLAVHDNGVVLSPRVSLTRGNALVSTAGISDIPIKNQSRIKTNYNGFAIIPNLVPYQESSIAIDMSNLQEDADVDITNDTIVPLPGSLVPVIFNVKTGERGLFTVFYKNKPVPLGANVFINNEKVSYNYVGYEGKVYLSGLKKNGKLTFSWLDNNRRNVSCSVNYLLNKKGLNINSLTCL